MTHGLETPRETLCGRSVAAVIAAEHTVTADPSLVDCLRCIAEIPAEPYPESTLDIIPTAERTHERISAYRRRERG